MLAEHQLREYQLAEHQTEAVERVLTLLSARGGALLADDVGLGKSFVAAESMRRWSGEEDRAGAIDLIVPAALVEQWRETLARFGVDAHIATHDGLAGEPFFPVGGRLVVVDEAHAFRNPRTRRYAALARRSVGARVLLITATPVCNSIADLEALVRLIARDDLLADAGVPSIDVAFENRDVGAVERIVASLIIRRDRSVLPPALRFGELVRRVIRHPVAIIPMLDELQFPLIGQMGTRQMGSGQAGSSAGALLRRFLRRRLESSEAALVESVRRQIRFYERALDALRSGRALPKRDYRRAFSQEEDRDSFQGILFWELFAPPGELDPSALRDEMARLASILDAARASPCEKRRVLIEIAAEEREPMLIFTGSAATARDLHETLRSTGRWGLITARERTRAAVLASFRAGRLDGVVSTDMCAEGLDLQRAGVVIHYDIPWNPVKLDQRNGRAHRIGQPRPAVRAIYFLPETRETRIVETIARKNRTRRRLLDHSPSSDHPTAHPTLPPRLTAGAAYLRLLARHPTLPDDLARRHKAGIEQLMEEMAREFLDQRRVEDLVALVGWEV